MHATNILTMFYFVLYYFPKGITMNLKTKLGLMLGKFPELAQFAGLVPHVQHKIPQVSDELHEKFQEYSESAMSADQTWRQMVKQYCGIKKTYTYTELDKAYAEHPDFAAAYELRQKTAAELQDLCRKHPELWRPGHDIEWFYDTEALKNRILEIVDAESDYLKQLENRAHELLELIQTHNEDSKKAIEALNEIYFVKALVEDIEKTIGDKVCKEWWDAIPEVIKHTYAKSMDDAMICALATNDKLADYVLNFETWSHNLNAQKRFVKLLQQTLNKRVFGLEQSLKCAVATNKNFDVNGAYYSGANKIAIGSTRFKKGLDALIGTIKHEYLGHYIDDVAVNYGIQGKSMANFIAQEFGGLNSHGNREKYFYVLRSPLLKTHYDINDITEDISKPLDDNTNNALSPLYAKGWELIQELDIFEYRAYRNRFDEQSAWLLSDAYDVANKVIEYRRTHGLPIIEKAK